MDYILTLGNVPDSCVDELKSDLASRGINVTGVIEFDSKAQYDHWSDAEAVGFDELIKKYVGDVELTSVVAVISPEEGQHPYIGHEKWGWLISQLLFSVLHYRVDRYSDGTDRFFLRAVEIPFTGFSEVVPIN